MSLTPLEIAEIAKELARLLRETPPPSSAGTELDAAEVATLLKVSKPTIERWTKQERIPSYRVGRLRRYNREAVLAAVQNSHSIS